MWYVAKAAVLVLILGLPSLEAAERDGLLVDRIGMVYYRQGAAIVESINAGDVAAAERETRALDELTVPDASVVAYVQNSIGVAYIRSRRFEAAIAHHEKALRVVDDRTPGLSESSHASLVYAHSALGRYETAERLLASRGAEWAWLFTGLASLYEDLGRFDCALALGERALELGRAGAVLNPSEPTTEAVDRDAVLRRWSDRVETIRHARDAAPVTVSADASRTACVGVP